MDNDEKKIKKNLPNVKVKMSGLSPQNKKKKNDNIKNNQKKYSSKEKKTKKKAKKENTPRLRDLLTDEQLEKIKAKRRHNALIVISVFLLTILFSGIILGIQFYANRSSLKFKENGTSGNINLVFLNYTVNKYDLSKGAMVAKFTSTEKKIKKSSVIFQGTEFINIFDIADFCGFYSIGTIDDIEFIVPNERKDIIEIMPSPNLIYINGIAFSVELRRISSHELYIPISFLTENINNLNIEYDEKGNTITVSRAFNEEEVMSEEDFVYYELETKNVKQNTIQNLIEDEYFTEEDEASQYGYYYG